MRIWEWKERERWKKREREGMSEKEREREGMSERPNEREGGKKGEEMRGLAESCFSPHPILRAQGPTAKHYH